MPTKQRTVRNSKPDQMPRYFFGVPEAANRTISKSVPVYGSKSRALQVATEILVQNKKPISLSYTTVKNGAEIKVSYKLLPRTLKIIDKLTPKYGTKGRVITACAVILERLQRIPI